MDTIYAIDGCQMGIVDGVRQRRALMASVSWRGLVPNVYRGDSVHARSQCWSDGDDGLRRACGYQSDVTGTWAWHEFENVLERGMRVVAALMLVQSPVCR
jgi:hypothetical protein